MKIVALKTFVDNVCRQVIERHITRPLISIYSAETVAGLSDEELARIASETPQRSAKRKQLQDLRRNLESSLGISAARLRRLDYGLGWLVLLGQLKECESTGSRPFVSAQVSRFLSSQSAGDLPNRTPRRN